jgi:hypothetical protein
MRKKARTTAALRETTWSALDEIMISPLMCKVNSQEE